MEWRKAFAKKVMTHSSNKKDEEEVPFYQIPGLNKPEKPKPVPKKEEAKKELPFHIADN